MCSREWLVLWVEHVDKHCAVFQFRLCWCLRCIVFESCEIYWRLRLLEEQTGNVFGFMMSRSVFRPCPCRGRCWCRISQERPDSPRCNTSRTLDKVGWIQYHWDRGSWISCQRADTSARPAEKKSGSWWIGLCNRHWWTSNTWANQSDMTIIALMMEGASTVKCLLLDYTEQHPRRLSFIYKNVLWQISEVGFKMFKIL